MLRPSPERFSPEILARQAERLSVELPLSRYARLAEMLVGDVGVLNAEFTLSRRGRHVVAAGQLQASCQLECQRCLQAYTHVLESVFELVLVPDLDTAASLDDAADPVVLDDDGMIDVIQLFEDELMLLVPAVPKHAAPEDCEFSIEVTLDDSTARVHGSDGAGSNAFAELKKLRF